MTLDDRLNSALGAAYRGTFGEAPAILPDPARGHTAAMAAGVGAVAVVAVAVALPLVLANTGTGTSQIRAGGQGSELQSGDPQCTDADLKLTAVVNNPSFPESVIEQTDPAHLSMTAFVVYSQLSGTNPVRCRSYLEAGATIGFVTPSGDFVGTFGAACAGFPGAGYQRHNRTGPAPTPESLPPCASQHPAPSANPGAPPLTAVQKQAYDDSVNDYGVLLSSAGTVSVSGDDVDDDAANEQLREIRAGRGPAPEPVYLSFGISYQNDQLLTAPKGPEVGTWKVRVTYGDLTAEAPFEVTAG